MCQVLAYKPFFTPPRLVCCGAGVESWFVLVEVMWGKGANMSAGKKSRSIVLIVWSFAHVKHTIAGRPCVCDASCMFDKNSIGSIQFYRIIYHLCVIAISLYIFKVKLLFGYWSPIERKRVVATMAKEQHV